MGKTTAVEREMESVTKVVRGNRILAVMFFFSGGCGLLYQVVWLRLAFATFGVVTSVLSVVVSVFMLGLAVGSWAGGKWIGKLTARTGHSAILFYALAEFVIGTGAFVVPTLFRFAGRLLLNLGAMDSVPYLFSSALCISISILPWCLCMGFTFPFMMAFVKERDQAETKSFSFLYTANVLGAILGAFLTVAALIEMLGLRHTLWVAGITNFAIAAMSILVMREHTATIPPRQFTEGLRLGAPSSTRTALKLLLFITGFTSLAMEVVWTRSFTILLGNLVYSYVSLLIAYLLATWLGSWIYRRDLAKREGGPIEIAKLVGWLAIAACLPILLNDPRFRPNSQQYLQQVLMVKVWGSIFPLCLLLGYLTPRLIDECSDGNPKLAGNAYAINVLGCILGPLCASYIMLPRIGAQASLTVLALPYLLLLFYYSKSVLSGRWLAFTSAAAAACLVCAAFVNTSYENLCAAGFYPGQCEVRRDQTATVTSMGEGMSKLLFVNGIGMTRLTPVTKFMAHLPLATLQRPPKSALVICFGMGTTYRSLLTWDIDATAVELVPSVIQAMPYYHANGREVLNNPRGTLVVDDGRRFLRRTQKKFDLITIDPPPPIEAAGSSLLYSSDFYEVAKARLNPGGILATWFGDGEEASLSALANSLHKSFPYVRVFHSVVSGDKPWGVHFLASMSPIEVPPAAVLVERMPPVARRDLMEWSIADPKNLGPLVNLVLSKEFPIKDLIHDDSTWISDDRPYNEYFIARRTLGGWVK